MADALSVSISRKTFSQNGHRALVLFDVDFVVPRGQILGIYGPSGCGKSTLIRILAGLDLDYSGYVLMGGTPVRAPTRRIGLTVQSHASYDWLTVGANIAFGLRYADGAGQGWWQRLIGRLDPTVAAREVRRMSELVGLAEADLSKYPEEISGGMRQRMTFARALLARPDILLLDEPFSALDVESREELQDVVVRVCDQLHTTIVFVSHDPDEVLYLADEVLVMGASPATVVHRYRPELPGSGSPEYRYTTNFQAAKRELRAWLQKRSPTEAT